MYGNTVVRRLPWLSGCRDSILAHVAHCCCSLFSRYKCLFRQTCTGVRRQSANGPTDGRNFNPSSTFVAHSKYRLGLNSPPSEVERRQREGSTTRPSHVITVTTYTIYTYHVGIKLSAFERGERKRATV